MQAFDFIYDDISLSNMGYVVCGFGTDSSIDTVTTDSQRNFQHASMIYGKYLPIIANSYSDHLEFTFQICKLPHYSNPILTEEEIRFIKRWLNRPTVHKFKIIHDGFSGIYFEGTFNVQEMRFGGFTEALELTFISNRPFALHEPIFYSGYINKTEDVFSVYDISDEIGWTYPNLKIICKADGDLIVRNSFDGRETIIKNCETEEEITFTPQLVIESSRQDHALYDDFNFNFLRIYNSAHQRNNKITSSIPCYMHISYTPIVKAVV